MTLIFLLTALGAAGLFFLWSLYRACLTNGAQWPRLEVVALGMVTNFFDTLGIGSFAPTMAWMKFRRLVPDSMIAPTMLAGHALPTFVQSAIFLVLLGVNVDPILLAGCCGAMVAGGIFGVPLVQRAPLRIVRLGGALALFAAAAFYVVANLDLMPGGGQAASLPVPLMLVAILAHLVFGILMNFGVGTYAPTLLMLSSFGMDPHYAFPIMASAGAFLMATSGLKLVRNGPLDLRVVIGMTLGGIPAVLVAAFIVRAMPVVTLRWLVVVVVLYAAISLLRSATKQQENAEEASRCRT